MTSPVEPGDTPDFLAVGHLTLDVTPYPDFPHGRVRPGGAAAFAALTAQAMGLRPAVVTSAGPDLLTPFPLPGLLPGVAVRVVDSQFTTVFQQVYDAEGNRSQVLAARAADIGPAAIPDAWRRSPIVFLGPLTREIPCSSPLWFPSGTTGVAVQGWLRRWDVYGRVRCEPGPPPETASALKLAVGSAVEFDDSAGAECWWPYAEVVGFTRGRRGTAVLHDGQWVEVAPYPVAREVDATGAGDIWAAACLIRLCRGDSPVAAARFANAAASVSVERPGLHGVPTLAEIESRLAGG